MGHFTKCYSRKVLTNYPNIKNWSGLITVVYTGRSLSPNALILQTLMKLPMSFQNHKNTLKVNFLSMIRL